MFHVVYVNIPEADWKARLVGYDCDGASVNTTCHGLKGYFQEAVPWIIMFWCLAHCLELAVKDALKSKLFDDVDNMLIHLQKVIQEMQRVGRNCYLSKAVS